ncbi:hypothetical protein KDV89_12365 [Providencia stuartii]|uniref:glycosyl hydrolase family 28-related protein n=1 Tax=Providencia stuartii TaxID=588 RepID=UPI00332263C2
MTTYNTGNKVGSPAVKDLFDNSENLDKAVNDRESEVWIDRLGFERLSLFGAEKQNERLVAAFRIESQQAILAAGYAPVGTFQEGAEIKNRNETVLWKRPDGDGEYYRWDGDLPKSVPENSTPQSTGGIKSTDNPDGLWVGVGDAAVRSERVFTQRPAGLSLTDFVSVKDYGAKGDGVTDDTKAIQAAIDNGENAPAYIPPGVYVISDTLVIGRGKALIGKVPVLRTDLWSTGAILSWGGAISPRKTMVLLGQNNVGEEPVKDATAVVLENVYLNGNLRIGFLVYGTYLTNDSWVRGVGGHGSTEYNFYFAKAWYASFCNIVSRQCKNNGIALGMPLYYSNGELVNWTSYAPLEMNQCLTDNIRSHAAGQRYSIDAPNTYDPKKSDAMRFSGYGIGAGVGNAFRLNNFLSEQSGGVNLYYYSEWQPSKHVSNGYLEASCLNSGLDAASTLPNIIIDVSVGTNGGGQVIEDLFMNYSSGGIYTVRRGQVYRPVELKRLYQPRFLRDLDGETDIDKPNHPLNFIKMSSVYHQLSGYNFLGKSIVFQKEDVNIRYGYSFSVPCYDTQDYFRVYFRRTSDNWNPSGSIQFELSNGENVSRQWPSEAPKGQWVSLIILGLFSRIKRGGDAGGIDQPVEFKIVRLPSTQP